MSEIETNDSLREAATMLSASASGCAVVNPIPYTPSWKTMIDFLDKYLKGRADNQGVSDLGARPSLL